jgi:HAD superfamily hydrolase (TIGR01490 family)
MVKSKKIKLALFDIDGTIFRSSLLIELINGLVEDRIFPLTAKKETEIEYRLWLDRKGDYEQYIQKVIAIHLKYIAGKSVVEVQSSAEQTIQSLRNRVYRYTRDLIKHLHKQNYHLVTISGSPTYIVSKFAKIMKFKAQFGSEYEVKNGIFTGKVLNLETFYKKAFVLQNYLEKNKLQVDFKNSIAVGDTESDIPMLAAVGKSIAFNPNSRLAHHAKKKGWDIIVERKDVIYKLQGFSFLDTEKK